MTKPSLPAPWPLLILLALLTLPAGCLSLGEGTRQSTRFTLAALETAPLPDLGRPGDSLHPGLGPLRFPAYLDRPQLVTRRSAHEVQVADFSRWAEPLNENLTRALAANLGVLLGQAKIEIFPGRAPWPSATRSAWTSCASTAAPIRWHALRSTGTSSRKGGPPVVSRQSEFHAQVAGTDDEAVVAALSATVAALSREIAAALVALPAAGASE